MNENVEMTSCEEFPSIRESLWDIRNSLRAQNAYNKANMDRMKQIDDSLKGIRKALEGINKNLTKMKK